MLTKYAHHTLDGERRWMAAETIFRILEQDKEIREILSPSAVCTRANQASKATFSRIQLIGGPHLDRIVPILIQRITACVVNSPPYRYQWLTRTGVKKSVLMKFMSDVHVTAEDALHACSESLSSQEKADLLAFRGLLAHGILIHCLKKRFRVDYGLKSGAKKRLAVPYRASDTPSDRSEFSQPDCAIIQTYLSYYYDGLTQDEVCVQAFLLSVCV